MTRSRLGIPLYLAYLRAGHPKSTGRAGGTVLARSFSAWQAEAICVHSFAAPRIIAPSGAFSRHRAQHAKVGACPKHL